LRVGGMQETATLSVNFNIKAKSFSEGKVKFDEKMLQINDYAGKQQLKKFELQSMNYSINAQPTYDNAYPSRISAERQRQLPARFCR